MRQLALNGFYVDDLILSGPNRKLFEQAVMHFKNSLAPYFNLTKIASKFRNEIWEKKKILEILFCSESDEYESDIIDAIIL